MSEIQKPATPLAEPETIALTRREFAGRLARAAALPAVVAALAATPKPAFAE